MRKLKLRGEMTSSSLLELEFRTRTVRSYDDTTRWAFLLCEKSLEEFWVAEKALENSLALKNSFRRDLLRGEMDQLKNSLEIPSLL